MERDNDSLFNEKVLVLEFEKSYMYSRLVKLLTEDTKFKMQQSWYTFKAPQVFEAEFEAYNPLKSQTQGPAMVDARPSLKFLQRKFELVLV